MSTLGSPQGIRRDRAAVECDALACRGHACADHMTSEREHTWSELIDATPAGWFVCTPVYHVERQEWAIYAFDTREKAHIGKRSREWTAIAPTEEGAVRETARCLREVAAGRMPT